MSDLVFLKLGGSLITDKTQPQTARRDTLARLAAEIASARQERPVVKLVLGHGSGSFGHHAASKHATRQGVHSARQWEGFVEVYRAARALNQIVLESLLDAGLPVIAFPPSAGVISANGLARTWDMQPLQAGLEAGLVPLINGDVIFDAILGGTILSTEELFATLAPSLHPQRILLAGIEQGVWADFPQCTRLVEQITPRSYNMNASAIGGSAAVDVTGGMRQKVESMLDLCQAIPGLEALIFSGEIPGNTQQALLGGSPGTLIRA